MAENSDLNWIKKLRGSTFNEVSKIFLFFYIILFEFTINKPEK